MSLHDQIQRWTGTGYRHLSDQARDVLDFRYAALSSENRWYVAGEPTLYIAGDVGVAIAEYGRHFQEQRTPELTIGTHRRIVYRLEMRFEQLIDLRQSATWDAISLAGAPTCSLHKRAARATAAYLRYTTPAQALLVPSVAFLDQLNRWCLVLFLEKLPADPHAFIMAVRVEGPLQWR
jgi:hypothetical protein